MSLWEEAKIIFALGAWVVLVFYFMKAGAELWIKYRANVKYISQWNWVVLAVDVPALFIQSPKAVEQIFAHLSGALGHYNVEEKFWKGATQKWFSFEVISIEGYIQFLIRTEAEFRDLVEAAIYAQYTEAEITEVEDYVNNIPNKYPDEKYDVEGIDFKLVEKDAFPIRTYPKFEYKISKDDVFSDPMAAILENFSRVSQGENLWLQIIIEPTDSSWKNEGIVLVKELMTGAAEHKKGSAAVTLLGAIPHFIMTELINIIHWNFEPKESAEHEKKADLSPGSKTTIEAVEDKIAKIGFKSKLRLLYAADKQVFKPSRCMNGVVGAMNQFHVQNSNALVPGQFTHAPYDGSHKKSNLLKRTFVKVFKSRKLKWKKKGGYILNIEELATLWHFPLPFVKTPLLQKAGYKRSEPPAGLPMEMSENPLRRKGIAAVGTTPENELPSPAVPPEELPFG